MQDMRRNDREITDRNEILEIIEKAQVCHIAMSDGDLPYIVAMNFGFDRNAPALYLHSASEGRKIRILSRNAAVCIQFDVDQRLVRGKAACDWGMNYRSVVGTGTALVLTDPAEKARGLDFIMEHYSGKRGLTYPEDQLASTSVIRIAITELRGKKKG